MDIERNFTQSTFWMKKRETGMQMAAHDCVSDEEGAGAPVQHHLHRPKPDHKGVDHSKLA